MSSSDNIKVCIRVRPFNRREYLDDPKPCVSFDQDRPHYLIVDQKLPKIDPKVFNFDWIAGERSTQQEIFEEIGRPLAETYIQGYNCCIFAYGQTGAGKTYTMQGRGLEDDTEEEDLGHRGLQPRIIDEIFELKAKEEAENPDVQFLIKCGYLEIYNEQIMDLLNPSDRNLCVREDAKEGVYIENLMELHLESSQDALKILRHGADNRHTGSTNMNVESSRSHSLFIMTIKRKTGTTITTSKFNFVDLAGSERQKATNTTGILLKEAGNINKSLSTLGLVINNLVEAAEGKSRHIAYRDSKLTHILKDSLGGNSKTCLIANISPAVSSVPETMSTLRFAQRAKLIKTKACINEAIGGDIEELKKECERLKKELKYYKQLELENLARVENKEEPESLQTSRQDSTRHNSQFLEQSKRLSDSEGDHQRELPFYSSLNDIQMMSSVNQTQPQSESMIPEIDIVQEENARLKRENQLLLEALNSATADMESYLINKEGDDPTANIPQQEKIPMEIEDISECQETQSKSHEEEANQFFECEAHEIPEKVFNEEGTMTDMMSELLEVERLRKERTRQDQILVEKMDQLAQAENLITQQKYKLLEMEMLRQDLQKQQEFSAQQAEKLLKAEETIVEKAQRLVEAEERNEALNRGKLIAEEEHLAETVSLREKVESLEKELNERNLTFNEGELLELKAANEDLLKQVENLSEQNQRLMSIKERNEVLEAELEKKTSEKNERLEERLSTLEGVFQEHEALKERSQILEEELERLANEKNEEEKRLKSILEVKEKELSEAGKIHEELALSQERVKILEEELQRLTKKKNEEESLLKSLIEEKDKKSEETEKIIQELTVSQERNKVLEEELERLTSKIEENIRLKSLLEEKEKEYTEAIRIPEELATSQEINRILEEDLQNEEREMASEEEKRLKAIIEEQTEKSIKDENRIQELEKNLELEREEKLSLEKILQDDIQDCSQSRAHNRTKEDNLNRLQERLLLKEQNNQDLQRENRLLEEAQKKQESFEEIIQSCQDSLAKQEQDLAKQKDDLAKKEEELEECEKLNQELFKRIEILNEEKATCLECSKKNLPEAPKDEEKDFEGLNDDKENDPHKKESKGKIPAGVQSADQIMNGKRSYEKVRNMNIERGVFSEQKVDKREAKDWELADDADDYDDLKLTKKVKPNVQ